ncbi:BON domain-containing protein [Rhodoligotrophos ferricapiens]|uniref:BON domain-containing protein n=1 Tax=Rhodoligotrophos ferricapiens TaxID=3069264 RepID=UPI00315CE1FA
MDDLKLRNDILDELEFEPSINAANIGVAVSNGIVTLSGHVASYAEKLQVEKVVRRVRGVRAIAEEIEVRYPSDKSVTDDDLARRAADALRWDVTVPHQQIELVVENGLVRLLGEVPWQFQRVAAEKALRTLIGLVGVANDIVVKPTLQQADVKKQIENALMRRAEIEASGISVTVTDGKVILDGTVDTWDEHDAVENAAWSAPGVKQVIDHLKIGR